MTATSFFPSRHRCCDQCCQRTITIKTKTGEKRKVTEYYHRGVVAHLVGFPLPVILDVEMIGPGEGEVVAARRLLQRLLVRYDRFFDAVEGDAIYLEGPFFNLCVQHGKHVLAVLKDNNPALLADAKALLRGEPDLVHDEDNRLVRYWDREHFTTRSIQPPLRVLRTEETETRRERTAGKWIEKEMTSTWFWATTIPQTLIPSRQLRRIGHERWKIENQVFNALGESWGLDHCFHHDPAAILNFILILFIAHTLVQCFYRLNMKQPLRKLFTVIAVARQILLGIASCRHPRRAAWLLPHNNPPPLLPLALT